MNPLHIVDTPYWEISYRQDARYPGSLIVACRTPTDSLTALDPQALAALGPALALGERVLNEEYRPHKVIVYKLGFSPGFSLHFHVLPVTADLLQQISAHPAYPSEPDGNDVILFVSREYAERTLSSAERLEQQAQIQRLRQRAATLA